MPLPNAIRVTSGRRRLPVVPEQVRERSRPARAARLTSRSTALCAGIRSASAPPSGPKIAIGTNAAAATARSTRPGPVSFVDVDAERDRLHPGADVRDERARPQARERVVAEGREGAESPPRYGSVSGSTTAGSVGGKEFVPVRKPNLPLGQRLRHWGARLSRNARMPSSASSACALSTITGHTTSYAAGSVSASCA